MNIVLFDEHEKIANELGNILKEKYCDIAIYTDLLSFLESFCDRFDFMNTIFILSESVLKNRSMKIARILKKFDCYSPILTYSVNDLFYLKLDINYIYEHQENNYKVFLEYIYKIEECFVKFVSSKGDFSSCRFQCEEVPVYLSNKKRDQAVCKLYTGMSVQGDSNVCLTKIQLKLFTLLLSHKEGLSLGEIACNLWSEDSKSKARNVYTLIHNLKRILLQKAGNRYKIVNHKKKYQLVEIIEPKTDTSSSLCNSSITGDINGASIIK